MASHGSRSSRSTHWSLESFQRIPGFDIHNSRHRWIANFMRDRKTNIEQDLPFIDFDFEGLRE